jgi:hypothetical protein
MKVHKTAVSILILISMHCSAGQAAVRRHPVPARPKAAPRAVIRPKPVHRRAVALPIGARSIVIGGNRYWVHAGVYYKTGDNGYMVVSAPVTRVLPRSHRVLLIHGAIYYICDDIYYKRAPEGYIVVEKPMEKYAEPTAAVPKTLADQPKTLALYVPKRTEDGFVPVTLKRLEGGYLGPQGEFYPTMPPVSQLTEMYGMAEVLRHTRPNVFFIHVPNKDGESFTRVTLTRHKSGFLGSQGEFYPLMPSVAHLMELYGTTDDVAQLDDAVRLQVPRKNGEGFVEVELKKHERGYLGPQGEFYPKLPSADQLKEMYGDD